MNEPEPIDPSQLRPGPIQHESLPPELLAEINAAFDVIGSHCDMTLSMPCRLHRKSLCKRPASTVAPVRRNANVEVPAFAVLLRPVVDAPELQEIDRFLEPLALGL